MSVTRSNRYWPALAAVSVLMLAASAKAQDAEGNAFEANAFETDATTVTPYAPFQYSSLTGSNNTVTVSRVPVITSSGTKYNDVTIQFTVSSTGVLALASGYPKVVASPTLITSGFVAGQYAGPPNVLSGKALINVSGPGVTTGNATEWTLVAASGSASTTYPCSATWYVGPLTSNPLYTRIKNAGITSTAYSYGVIGSAGCSAENNYWDPDTLIGLSQVGNTITISSYSFEGSGRDYNTPQDQITYTKK
jgi:hypothetical protein